MPDLIRHPEGPRKHWIPAFADILNGYLIFRLKPYMSSSACKDWVDVSIKLWRYLIPVILFRPFIMATFSINYCLSEDARSLSIAIIYWTYLAIYAIISKGFTP